MSPAGAADCSSGVKLQTECVPSKPVSCRTMPKATRTPPWSPTVESSWGKGLATCCFSPLSLSLSLSLEKLETCWLSPLSLAPRARNLLSLVSLSLSRTEGSCPVISRLSLSLAPRARDLLFLASLPLQGLVTYCRSHLSLSHQGLVTCCLSHPSSAPRARNLFSRAGVGTLWGSS